MQKKNPGQVKIAKYTQLLKTSSKALAASTAGFFPHLTTCHKKEHSEPSQGTRKDFSDMKWQHKTALLKTEQMKINCNRNTALEIYLWG